MKKLALAIAALVLLSLSGVCRSHAYQAGYTSANITDFAYKISSGLYENIQYKPNRTLPILYSSFVDLDNLSSASTLGRLLGEEVASKFAQYGYRIEEVKLRKDSLLVREGRGEFALSRDNKDINGNYEAQAVIVGTYTLNGGILHVNAKLVSALDNTIMSSCDLSAGVSEVVADMAAPTPVVAQAPPAAAKGPVSSGLVLLDTKVRIDAKIIQTRLHELGYYKGKVDGAWGGKSREAVKAYRKSRGMAATDAWSLEIQKDLFGGTNQ